MKIRLAFFSFLFFVNGALATPLDENALFSKCISTLQTKNLDFVMTKKIPHITRVFESAGKIKFERDKGFIFQQHYPNIFTFISTKDRYCTLKNSDELKKLPHFSDISQLIDDILSLDYNALNNSFEADYQDFQNAWKLELIPKISELKRLFNRFVLEGNADTINNITIEYKDGTVVKFTFFKAKDVIKDDIRC